jgi:hypothetical protein
MRIDSVIATWDGPSWAQVYDRDDEAMIYSRRIGAVTGMDDEELSVELVQRDDITTAAEQSVITRSPIFVRVACTRVGLAEADELGRLLASARMMIEGDRY